MEVREAKVGDENKLLDLFRALDSETGFMLFEPGERKTTASEQAKFLDHIAEVNNILLLVAEGQWGFNGFLGATGNTNNRDCHILNFVVGVKKSCWGQGIGKSLIIYLQSWALDNGYRRLELTVQESNERAINLYKSQGFEIEGVRRQSLKIDGEFVNELYMAKLIKA